MKKPIISSPNELQATALIDSSSQVNQNDKQGLQLKGLRSKNLNIVGNSSDKALLRTQTKNNEVRTVITIATILII